MWTPAAMMACTTGSANEMAMADFRLGFAITSTEPVAKPRAKRSFAAALAIVRFLNTLIIGAVIKSPLSG